MSQRVVERLLGRLLTDREFRHVFYEDPAATCVQQSFELTPSELEALARLDEARIEAFSRGLDARIIRAAVNGMRRGDVAAMADDSSNRRPQGRALSPRGASFADERDHTGAARGARPAR
ncbi:MAG: Franean1_4349 family RiPP [Deltaproteobacteria bacterium]|nr:Franean1_4349 family RiPP [Deltaproteobacteria bacterium]